MRGRQIKQREGSKQGRSIDERERIDRSRGSCNTFLIHKGGIGELARVLNADGELVLTTMNLFSPMYFPFRIYVRLSRILRREYVHTSESPVEKAFHKQYVEKMLGNAGFCATRCIALCLPSAEVPSPLLPFFARVDRLMRRVSRLWAVGADLVIRTHKPANK